MKRIIGLFSISLVLTSCAVTQKSTETIEGVYEVTCGLCNFEMTGDECALAIKIENKHYYVEGSAIDEHGDAHADDGLCTVVRKANVRGVIKRGVFQAESIELIEE
jgi:hypothetical protein